MMKRKTPFTSNMKLNILIISLLTISANGERSTRQREYRTVQQNSNIRQDGSSFPSSSSRSNSRKDAYPYNDDCPPQTEGLSQKDIEEANFRCELKKWYKEMSGNDEVSARRNKPNYRTQTALPNLATFKSERPYTPGGGYKQDCLYYKRSVRPYPGTCYKPVLLNRNTHAISQELINSWVYFFQEIAGDFMYTFDFVLWSEQADIHDNFWYLMLFLKEMAITIDNPMDVVSKKFHDSQMAKIDSKLQTANNTLARHSENLDSLEKSLVSLSGQISNYQNIMTTLQNKLNKIISAMPYDQVDQSTLLGKLNYLSMQSILVGGLFNNSNFQETKMPLPPPPVELPKDKTHPYYKYNPLEKIISSHLEQSQLHRQNPKYHLSPENVEAADVAKGQATGSAPPVPKQTG